MLLLLSIAWIVKLTRPLFEILNHGVSGPLANQLVATLYLSFMFCITWIAHVVWAYCFRSVVELLATARDRAAAGELRKKARPLRRARLR